MAVVKAVEEGTCKPNIVVDSTIVEGYMVNMNIEPNVPTLTVVVDALCKEGMIIEAHEGDARMIQGNFEPDEVTYNALVDSNCLPGQMDNVIKALEEMVEVVLSMPTHIAL
ncbi:Pentatricopeptide repeat [Dillenia turbinata]|uniref:Pentatricopeptide repeat n=1 Tax=Dillenia turbinata TaxID=194707 RepID=A0AAN8UEA3_9MAGN